MEEECRRNEITPEKTKESEDEEKLKEEKPKLMEDYEYGLTKLKEDISNNLNKINNSNFFDENKRERLINKFLFLERQLNHDFFNITFEWFS
jgi:hypothetical protein